MELREAIRTRRMRRRCGDEPLATDTVIELLDMARRAPSAGFAQGQAFVLLTAQRDRLDVAAAAGEPGYVARGFEPWISSAPVLVVPCADVRAYDERYAEPDKRRNDGPGIDGWEVPYWWLDLGAAVQNLLLLATEAGLAAAFLGAHAVDGLDRLLRLPERVHPAGVVTLGHPTGGGSATTTSEERGRRVLDTVVHLDHWHEPG